MRYFIDWLGQLWRGPGHTGGNLHYARFHGRMVVPPWEPIWVYERTDPPEDADEVTEHQAAKAICLFGGKDDH